MDIDLNTILTSRLPRRGGRSSLGPVLLALLALGCQHAANPPTIPEKPLVVAGSTHYLGTPLSGPRAEPVPAGLSAGNAWAVEVTIVSLERMPVGGESLAKDATFLTATRGASVVLPSSRLTRGARYAPPDQPAALAGFRGGKDGAGHVTELLPPTAGAVPVGATASFKVVEQLPDEDRATDRPWRRGIEVDVFRPAPASTGGTKVPATAPAASVTMEVALVVDDFAQPDRVDSSAEMPAPDAAPSPQREVAIVDIKPVPSRQTLALAVPFRFKEVSGQAVAAIITVGPPTSDKGHLDAFNNCKNDLALSSAIAISRALAGGVGVAGEDAGSALQVALDTLKQPWRRRSALIYLAGVSGASLCGDATLVADGATLDRIAGKVIKSVAGHPPDPEAIGWLLDQVWLLDMGELLGNAKLSPELSAVLATHAGEVGRHQSSIEEVAKASHSHADYEALLLQENLIFLEDSSPSARARAFDWLQGLGKAPAGYDPLGGERARHAALERAANGLPPQATEPATEPATGPTSGPTTGPTTEPTAEPTIEPATGPTTTPSTEPATEPSATTAPATELTTKPAATTLPTTRPATAPISTTAPPLGTTTVPYINSTTGIASLQALIEAADAATEPRPFDPNRQPNVATETTQTETFHPEPGPPIIRQTVPRNPTTGRAAPSTQPTTTPSQEAPHE